MTRVDCKNILQSNDFVAFFLDEAFNNVKKKIQNYKIQMIQILIKLKLNIY